MKKSFLMAAAAVMMFASCAKEGENTPADKAKKTVTVKIDNMASLETRAVGEKTEGSVKVVAETDLTAMFFTAANVRTSDPSVSLSGGGEYTFHLLQPNVQKVVITNMSETEAAAWLANGTLPTDLAKWNPASGNVQKTPVIGVSSTWEYVGQDEEHGIARLYNAGSITVNAIFARFEISGIDCTDLGDGRFTALGYQNIGIFYGSTQDEWAALDNWQKDAITSSNVGGTFVYNVPAGDNADVPNIVLQIGKTGTTSAYPNLVDNIDWPYFVRTNSLYEGEQDLENLDADDLIDELVPGAIYQIEYAFADDNVKPWTGEGATTLICVDVTVTIETWKIKPVITPIFN